MKKFIILIALSAFFLSTKSKAQTFIASYGVSHSWGIPDYVYHSVYDRYYGYDIVHANRIWRNGFSQFDLVLQRGNVFVNISLGANGRFYGRRVFDYYPLHNHVCAASCGFHPAFYNTFSVIQPYGGHHRHHRHVVYRPGVKVVYNYGANHPYYRNGHNHWRNNGGNNHTYNKGRDSRHRNARNHVEQDRYKKRYAANNSRARSGEVVRRGRAIDRHQYDRERSDDRNRTGRSKYKERSRGKSETARTGRGRR